MKSLVDLIDRAAKDPEFLAAALPAEQLKTALGMPSSSEHEIAQTLQARISHATHGKQ
ncbi:MAG TPA: hypothetical protein VKW08_01175 [Xanthobacteraceae bacterium]|jgi:hypothetical protein|nr:hypothetical protein [Xanthobacteraceae bacterium]